MSDCIEAAGTRNRDGYVRVSAYRFGRRITFAHQVALIDHLGRLPNPGYQANHHCDNPACISVAPGHLYEGTQTQNIADRTARHRGWSENARQAENRARNTATMRRLHADPEFQGKLRRGIRAGALLTEAIAEEIRARYRAGGISQAQLAAEFGIGQSHVSQIVRKKIWRT